MKTKEKMKTQTTYVTDLSLAGFMEAITIIQEENVVGRNAIKLLLYEERWRAPKDTIELLKAAITLIEDNFCSCKGK